MSERFPDGLPETHFALVYFERSTWAHLRPGRRVRGQWLAARAVDMRLDPVPFDDPVTLQTEAWMAQTEEFIRRLRVQGP